jgi:acyl-CoA reductase-like NAD-dependent aldehyde dehydrogenase
MSRTNEVPDLRPFIHGVHVDSHTNVTLPSIDPATETELWTLPAGDVADVDAAVDSARDAFDHGPWRHDPSERSAALLRLADLVETHAARIALLDTLEVGIPVGVTTADAAGAAAILRDIVAMADSVADDVTAPSVRLPRGVIATIAPWNFPFFVALTKIAPALTTGNVVVLKPSEIASASALLVAELAMEAGFPPGVLNVVPGRGAVVGDALVRRRGVDQVNLTGSLETGRAVLRASAESTLVPVVTELGGKSAHVVTEHAPDLDTVADAIAAGIFWCAGQVCTSGSRVIVHERHHDELLERLVARAGAWLPSDPHDPEAQAGPLATAEHLARVHRHVQNAVESGARLVAGGEPGPRARLVLPADDPRRGHARPPHLPRGGVRPGARRHHVHEHSSRRSNSPTPPSTASRPPDGAPKPTRQLRWRSSSAARGCSSTRTPPTRRHRPPGPRAWAAPATGWRAACQGCARPREWP